MAARLADPRLYQIAVLSGLLLYGVGRLHFDIGPTQTAVTLLTVLGVQWLCTLLTGGERFEPKSALISGLSLCLLLRTNVLWLAAAGAGMAVASKFLLRWRGKHLFNPTNFALVGLLLCADGCAWVSPAQWGNVAFFAFASACLGGLVLTRAGRADVALSFLAFYLGLVFAHSWYLGEPLAIPLHRLQSGALLIFAFFMISDPRTTPNSRAGRVIFALLVAFGAWYMQFRLFRTNGLLWSLALSAVLVPLLDWFLPGPRYRWLSPAPSDPSAPTQTPTHDENSDLRRAAGVPARAAS